MPSSPPRNAWNCAMSVPAMKALPPAPRNTAARSPSSLRICAQASPSCSYMRHVMALRAAGRSKITVATSPSRAYRTSPSVIELLRLLRLPPFQSRPHASPDLIDHGAVVQVSLPLPHAGFQDVGVDFEQRKPLLHPFGLFEHEVDVLEMLGDAAFGIKFAADHLRTLDVHDLRIGGRAARDLEKSLRIEPKSLGKYQALGHGQSVEAEDKIDGELGAPAISDLAHMEIGRKQRAQDRFDCGRDLRIAADQPDALAAADLPARAGDRGFQQAQPARRNALAECGDAVGVAGARAQHDFAGAVAYRGQQCALDDRLDLIRAEHREHDGIATPREIGDRRSRPAAKLRELGIFDGIDVEANDLEAGAEQAMRERLTQQTDADKADWVAIWHEPHPSQTVANRRHVSHARAAYVTPALASNDTKRLLPSHQPSDAMPGSRAAISRLSRRGLGMGMPFLARSCRLRWLCSPGSQMRSTPGNRCAPRMARIAASTWRLNAAAGANASTDTARMAWPVLVALPCSLTKSTTSRPNAA